MRNFALVLVVALALCLAACDFNGGVEQGRCVAYNPDEKTVTLVVDTTLDQHNPHYNGGVHVFKLPENPLDMGPAPVAGGLLMVQPDKNLVLYYDRETGTVKEMPIEMVAEEKGVNAKSPSVKGKTFPVIDKAKGTVTVYSPRLEELLTFKVSPEALELPAYTWELGDEVRIAIRKDQPGHAIRFMNVSKTSIFTR
ncbi:MAG: DUF4881 domain-containing protein [Desulfovibrio sp.]|nr:DUF4881 domain-containing protein [Desulfovibrio sp.]